MNKTTTKTQNQKVKVPIKNIIELDIDQIDITNNLRQQSKIDKKVLPQTIKELDIDIKTIKENVQEEKKQSLSISNKVIPKSTKVYDDSFVSPNFNKYRYVIEKPIFTKALYIFGIISWYITMIGYFDFLKLDIIYAIIFTPVLATLTLSYTISFGINTLYKKPNIEKHFAKVAMFTLSDKKPYVDIILPVCGEDIEVLERTFKAVRNLDYPNYKVYVLDDANQPSVTMLATKYSFRYFSRPNRGEMKKAGNLKYGFEKSNSEYVVIYDADFAPLPEFLNETLPYIIEDPKMAILQTPQYFETNKSVHDRNWLEYGASSIQEDFYRTVQVSRGVLGGSICVGTNALYRRSALEKVGGTAQIEHSEDVWTGIKVKIGGFTVKYIPYILAQGFCPDKVNQFIKQQYRWCLGSMSLMFSGGFWKAKLPILTKLCYISGFLYYITSLFRYILPFVSIFVIFRHYTDISFKNAYFFYPFILYSYILVPLSRLHRRRLGSMLAQSLAFSSYSLAIMHTMLGLNMAWVPTGSKVKKDFWILFSFYTNLVFFISYAFLSAYAFYKGNLDFKNINHYVIIFWLMIMMFEFSIFMAYFTKELFFQKKSCIAKP